MQTNGEQMGNTTFIDPLDIRNEIWQSRNDETLRITKEIIEKHKKSI